MTQKAIITLAALLASTGTLAYEIRHSLEIAPEYRWSIPAEWDVEELKIFYWTDFGMPWSKDQSHRNTMPSDAAIRKVAIEARQHEFAVIDLEGGIWAMPCCRGQSWFGRDEQARLDESLSNVAYVMQGLRKHNSTTKFGFWAKPSSAAYHLLLRQYVAQPSNRYPEPWELWRSQQRYIAERLGDHIDFCVIDGYQRHPNIDLTLRYYADAKAMCDYLYEIPTALYIWFKRPLPGGNGAFLDHATFRMILGWADTYLDKTDMLVLWTGRHHLNKCGDIVCPRAMVTITEPADHPKKKTPSNSWIIDNRERRDMVDYDEAQWIFEFEKLLKRNGQLNAD